MIQGFLEGFTAYFRALSFIINRRLWSYLLVPCLVSLIIAIIFLSAAWGFSDDVAHWISNFYSWDWGKGIFQVITQVITALLVVFLGILIYKNLVIALASPFMSPLSEKVEIELKGREGIPPASVSQFIRSLSRGLRIALRNIILELGITFLLLLLGFIPFFSPVTPFLIFAVQAYYAGFGNFDYTLERYFNVSGSVQFVRQNRWIAIGNGTAFLLLLFTGIGFLLAPPLGAVAGTMTTIKRL